MRTILLLLSMLTLLGCNNTPEPEKASQDEVDDFMEKIFGEDKAAPMECKELISTADFSNLCITDQNDYRVIKDVQNALICIYVLRSEYSTVDIAINSSPMAMLTGQIFKAAKSDAANKGKVKKVRKIGEQAFYTTYKFAAGEYSIENRDFVFYEGKAMYTLHTVSSSKKKGNCMSDENQLKNLAKALLKAAKQ